MKKCSVEIKDFNNFSSTSSVKVKSFYNYYPTEELKSSYGVRSALFPYSYEDRNEYNLDIESAGLTSVNGIAYLKQYFANQQITQHRLLVYGNDKKVYINQLLDDTEGLFWMHNMMFESAPITLAYKKDDEDSIILAGSDKMMVWEANHTPYTIQDAPIITSMCMNDGVLFCTIREPAFKVWYATDLDATNIGNIDSTSGYISLEDDLGYARKILSFNQNVYVFRDYGISKINFVKNQVSVTQVYASNTKIFTSTVSACGNVVVFLTVDGLYTFNGVKVSKSEVNLGNKLCIENDGAVASSLGEKYYLAAKLNFDDNLQLGCEANTYVNNAIIIVDTLKFTYQIIRGVDVGCMLPLKTPLFEKMLLTFNSQYVDKVGEIIEKSSCFGVDLEKFWQSDVMLDQFAPKTLTKLKVIADKDVTFTLVCDGTSYNFKTSQNGVSEFSFKLYCKQVELKISSSKTSADVKKVCLEYVES
ncbi:MAG: hypothetical protein MJ149_01330 [Clostridia bacterium]|nr:hypothetical protein [Clostridia bacterium]